MSQPRSTALRVAAPGRLHLGFVDPSGSLGRAFGSLGLMIDGFQTVLDIEPARADRWQAHTPAAAAEIERAAGFVQSLRQHTGRHEPLALHLHQVLPAHAGLGSGTQLALAVGRAFACWQGLALSTPLLAQWLGRGRRSGIGIAGFDSGGLLLDGGPGPQGQAAAVLVRCQLPEAWRVVVVLDEGRRGLSGVAERTALAALVPMPRAQAADLCHKVLMQVLPGVAEDNFAAFAAGINHMQELLGRHFGAAQGGSAWTSAAVGQLLDSWRGPQVAVGQSSWGPTGFAFVPSAAAAQGLIDSAKASAAVACGLGLHVVRACDRGATLSTPR